ncbi:MAG: glycosyltransferase [Candidatus Gracilibacteria bacterium]|nr:glycosyltransferase [Candidatus Gracilibacteria bacterium]
MKILFITNSLYDGGSNKVCSDLEHRFTQENNTLTIVLDSENNNKYNIDGEIRNICVGTRPFPFRAWISLFLQIFKSISIIRQYKPDVIISFSSHSNLINLITRYFYKTKRILTHHEDTFNFIQQHPFVQGLSIRFFNAIVFALRRESESFVCVSNIIAESLRQHYKIQGNIDVIHNGIDIEKIDTLKQEPIDINYRYIINVGTLCDLKNQELLIKAYSCIHTTISEHLLFIGDGPSLNKLQLLAKELNIENKVHFLGFQINPYKYLSKSSLFVFTSKTESFCLALIEAMYIGIPCIAVKNSGIIETVGESQGALLLDNPSPDSLGNTILEMVNNQTERNFYSEKGKERALYFSLEEQYRKFLLLINSV